LKTGSPDVTLVHVGVSNPRTIPVGALYIAAVLRRSGYGVDFATCTRDSYWQLDPALIGSHLTGSAGVVGISCMSDTLPFVVAALAQFKAANPEKTVILGGPGPTGVARELVGSFPFIDIVAVGEGEHTMLELAECLCDGGRASGGRAPDRRALGQGRALGQIRGICFRDGAEACLTPARERIRDLDQLPVPLYEAVKVEDYPMANIVFSRGCPYGCTFCDVAPMWQRKNFQRSVDSVIDEIKLLKGKYGRRHFEFTDETFVLGRVKVMEFCERLKHDGLDIKWSCTGRVNLVTRDLLAEMASSGCEAMFFGIESGSDRVLDEVNKDFTVAEALEALTLTLEYMKPVASFIWGFPFETEQDLMGTLLLMVYLSQLGVDSRLNRLAPFPLMPLYEQYGEGIRWLDEPGQYSGREPFQVAGCAPEVIDLVRTFPKIFPSFYGFPTDGFERKTEIVRSLGRYWQMEDTVPCRDTI